ncbi:MAG: hypothetical protein ACFFB0_13375 [Promethearchaeota archaeon]
MSKDTELHIVLVCHTELDFDGSWQLFEKIQPKIEDVFDQIFKETGKNPKVTYCITEEFLSEHLEDIFRFIEEGHEIGIHSHLPGSQRKNGHTYKGRYAYCIDENGVLNQDRIAGAIRQMAIALDIPPPVTHVSGMFTFHTNTIQVLEEAGFKVDCSLVPGEKLKHPATGDFILADNSRHKEFYPYRPSTSDPWIEGRSSIIELPVSGNLGGGDIKSQINYLRNRLRGDLSVDVFQSFWHHFEFAELGWTKGTLNDVYEFLMMCAVERNVIFSTALEAVRRLEELGL